MTTLVSGATGRLGSRLVPRLLGEEEPVRVVVRNRGAAEPLRAAGAEVVLGDLRERDVALEAVDGVDAICTSPQRFAAFRMRRRER
jgi:uncharacterized protein YbjT (DUF2867 family)